MQTTIYADGIANITMLDGVVRFDLINITQIDKEKSTAKSVGAVAMSVPALLRSYTELSAVINKLVEQGVLKKTDTQTPAATGVQVSASPEANVIAPLVLN